MKIEFDGIDELAAELKRLNSVEFNRVCKKQLGQMLNRARKNLKLTGEGTPVGKDRIVKGKKRQGGELRISSSSDGKNEMGYSAEYAPHVEYGHRLRGGGWVNGQYYLKKNTDKQREIFKEDLIRKLKG